ncbi:hypothetical protein BpHYR1_037413, partial [Brachionus plicatilis]
MADIESDLEDMLEAPYKTTQQCQSQRLGPSLTLTKIDQMWLYSQPCAPHKWSSFSEEEAPVAESDKKSRKPARSRSRSKERHRKRSRSRSKRSKRSRSKDRRRRSRDRRHSRSRSKRRSRSKDERRRHRRHSRDPKRSPVAKPAVEP